MGVKYGKLSCCVFLVVLISLVSFGVLWAQELLGKEEVIVFKFNNKTKVGGKELGMRVAAELKNKLTAYDKYAVITFDPFAAAVKRAIEEKLLSEQYDLAEPFDETAAIKIGKVLGLQYGIIGSIDDYKIVKERNVAEVTLSFTMYNISTEAVKSSGQVVGAAKGLLLRSEEEILKAAVDDATRRAVFDILGIQIQVPTTELKAPAKPRNPLVALLGFALFLALLGK